MNKPNASGSKAKTASVNMKLNKNKKDMKPKKSNNNNNANNKNTNKPSVTVGHTPKKMTTVNPAPVARPDGEVKRWAGGAWAHSPDPKDLPLPCFDVGFDQVNAFVADFKATAAVNSNNNLQQCRMTSSTTKTATRRPLATARVDWSKMVAV